MTPSTPLLALVLAAGCRPPAAPTSPSGAGSTGGADGTNGADGADGSDGADGADGADGTDGTDATDATDATDGETGDPPEAPAAGNRGMLIAQSWDERSLPTDSGVGQYRIIVLQESMYSFLPEYRAANPDARFLAYQKVGGMRADGDDHPSTGVQTGEAESEESWFLHDSEGNRLEYCDYAGVAAANIGDTGYQARWLANVTERLARDGFDGVMMDDVNTFPGHCLGSRGTPLAEYATDEAYGDAVVAFMTAVGPALLDQGFIVAPNIAMNPWNDTMLAQSVAMLPSISHWFREYWMRWDDSENFRGANWETTLQTMVLAQEAGRGYLGLTLGPGAEGGPAGQRYGRASWLLAWDGLSDSAWGYKAGLDDPFGPDWGPDIGLPDGPAVAVGGGWMRAYTGGVVLINPSETDDLVFILDDTYVDADGVETDRLSLNRGQAAVLTTPPSDGG